MHRGNRASRRRGQSASYNPDYIGGLPIFEHFVLFVLPLPVPLHRRTVDQITYRRNPMAEAVQNKCAHPKCTCPVSEGTEYCSQACSEAAESGSLSNNCGCDHPGCIGAIAA